MRAARRGAALCLLPITLLVSGPRVASGEELVPGERRVFLFRISFVSFEQMMSVPEVAALARAGGAGLLSDTGGLPRHGDADALDPGIVDQMEYVPSAPGRLAAIGKALRDRVQRFGGSEVLVVVVSLVPSPEMVAAKDELRPVVMATGAPRALFPTAGEPRSLTSDSTRRAGVVTDLDVQATIAHVLGEPLPEGGSLIREVDEPAPFELHERYLAQRRMYVPIGTAAGLYVTFAGLLGVLLLALRRAPRRLLVAAAWAAMSVPTLSTGLLAAGHLPTLSYGTVVPFVVAVTAVGTLAFVPLSRRGALAPAAAIGGGVLAYFVVEAALGWSAFQAPFLGGAELDTGRFYGLSNAFIGLLIGSSLYVAHRLPTAGGFGLIVAVALFAGLPFSGANLGAAVSLFAAAGLWLALRRSGRIGPRGLALAAGIVVAGTAVIVLAHVFLSPTPTHVTRFAESSGGVAGALDKFVDRLLVGWRMILANPFALIPVLGLLVCLRVVLRPRGRVGEALAAHPAWSDALLVTLLAGAVAYAANDSGPAAAGLAFGLGLGGLLHVSLLEQAAKMRGP